MIYDDRCGFCRTSVGILRRLDWLGRHEYAGSSDPRALERAGVTPDEAAREVKLALPGRVVGGYDAIREALKVMPLTFWLTPVLGLKPVRLAGRRIYRAIASRRKCAYAA
ncbi:MAG: DUF393 domain-containing protein [Bryobacteraceae bacterium]|nr:DUF393 domain-containing protein [Bryobacteraceae bacterium]